MTKKIEITIDDEGIHYDLHGFQGDTCVGFTRELEAALARDHGVLVEGRTRRRKAATPARTRQGQNQMGGA